MPRATPTATTQASCISFPRTSPWARPSSATSRNGREQGAQTMSDALASLLEPGEAERLATGFVFTEGPLWHPDGFYYFVDVRASKLYRLIPGRAPELLREGTG